MYLQRGELMKSDNNPQDNPSLEQIISAMGVTNIHSIPLKYISSGIVYDGYNESPISKETLYTLIHGDIADIDIQELPFFPTSLFGIAAVIDHQLIINDSTDFVNGLLSEYSIRERP